LLYNGRYNERHDFIALELIDGRLQFSFSLGANLSHVLLEQPYSLADGDWHTVSIDYFNRVSRIEPFSFIIGLDYWRQRSLILARV